MKTTSYSIKFRASKSANSAKKSADVNRAARIEAANAFLESTREQFSANVTKAKSRLRSVEAGVLAGPVARTR